MRQGMAFQAVLASMLAAAQSPDIRSVPILFDFADRHAEATAAHTYVNQVKHNPSGGEQLRVLFVHPEEPPAPAATLTWQLNMSAVEAGEALLLLFHQGLSDGWSEATDPAVIDGVRYQVTVDGELLHDEAWRTKGWGPRALDLTRFGGRSVTLTLGIDRNGTPNADWANWGAPRLVLVPPGKRPGDSTLTVLTDDQAVPAAKISPTADGGIQVRHAGAVTLQAVLPDRGDFEWMVSLEPAQETEVVAEAVRYNTFNNALDVIASCTRTCPADRRTLVRLPFSSAGDEPVRCRLRYRNSPDLTVADAYWISPQLDIRITRSGPNHGLVFPGSEVQLVVQLENRTPGAKQISPPVALELDAGSVLTPDGTIRHIEVPPLPRSATTAWRIRAPGQTGTFPIRVYAAIPPATCEILLRVVSAPPALPADPPQYGRAVQQPGLVILEGNTVRLAAVGSSGGFEYALVDGWDGNRWQRVGAFPHLGLVVAGEHEQPRHVYIRPQVATAQQNVLALMAQNQVDAAGVRWSAALTAMVEADGLNLTYVLEADRPVDVWAYRGPELLVGETAFGVAKDAAILPGLEYLEAGEVSNSTRATGPREPDRSVPHPLKLTAPLMAVEAGGFVTALGWSMDDRWDGSTPRCAVVFASPNQVQLQENHLLGLWLPSLTSLAEEGRFTARKPYSLLRGTTLTLRTVLWVQPQPARAEHAFRWWARRFGLPSIQPSNDLLLEYLPLARHAYLNALWSDNPKGWGGAVGWAPAPQPGVCTLLLFDGWLEPDGAKRAAVLERAQEVISAIASQEPSRLGTMGDCHAMAGELPFYAGYVARNIRVAEESARALARAAQPDGTWVYQGYPDDPMRRNLGRAGETGSGLCDRNAFRILRAAHLGGDPELAAAGRKAVEALRRFRVPRAAQLWEVPLHAPDILSSAYCVRAFVEAYELFGEPAYLEDARRFAETGLPFVYLWSDQHIRPMAYATIPVFGSSFFLVPWFGVPVQWCGLEYAYALKQLARHDPDPLWARLAKGIAESGIRQTYREGPNKGTLPDSWNLQANRPQPVDVNPSALLATVLAALGHDPRIKFAQHGGWTVASGAEIEQVTAESRHVAVRIRLLSGATSYTLVRPVPVPPEVTVNREPCVAASDESALAAVRAGHYWVEERGWLIVKQTHGVSDTTIEVRW